jgi:porphobilinogen synthase
MNQVEGHWSGNAGGLNALRARSVLRSILDRKLLTLDSLVMTYVVIEDDMQCPPMGDFPVIRLNQIGGEAAELRAIGIKSVKIFVRNDVRDRMASAAGDPDGLMPRAIRAFRAADPDICIHTETCLCPYTDGGTCVVLTQDRTAIDQISFDRFHELAKVQAMAGANVLAPAANADGTVQATREAMILLGRQDVAIMPHLIIDSKFYGPYRQATGNSPAGVDRRNLQIQPSRPDQAVEQARRFVGEGADMILLEPALTTMDLLVELKKTISCPLGAFSVSGEYKMLRDGVPEASALERMIEAFTAMKRAGADLIVTYGAKIVGRALH